MYTVAVRRDFNAYHALIGGDWGDENKPHVHHYVVEARFYGSRLDQHGYLIDIYEVETRLDHLVAHYKDATLNELPEFKGLNPSIEHFSRIICRSLAKGITTDAITKISIKIWESESAWAEYQETF